MHQYCDQRQVSEFGTGLKIAIVAAGIVMLLLGCVGAFFLFNFNTRYASGYSEKAFDSIKLGDTEQTVLASLGKPLSSDETKPFVEWIYSPDPQPDFHKDGIGNGTYTMLRFDSSGKFESAFGQRQASRNSFMLGDGQNSLRLRDAQIKNLKGSSEDEMRQKFGAPLAIYEYKATKVLRYSDSPSSSNYHLRTIGVNADGKVVHIWREIYWD